ncbi:monovalent cation:proton antiporter-2 (CPA2) family protein [Paraferrimonas sp. SM1919]|uniref:monovalent cation:proton antiporter-2 (CPA2) family protein n=1 Tax=Paraferrimonas sp. SM1919 TaxID=2662263 RepID=UPI0013D5A239|nr:monovalent cation:proton antiporter-2 (CPA2) family protein [Paraferrimonas sp. SM1919]
MTELFLNVLLYMVAAVIAVPLANRLGLGSVLGYLIAGLAIGPMIEMFGNDTTSIQHFAEFGVVMMLFLVGLELEPQKLWQMRGRLFGLGGLQLGLSAAVITGLCVIVGVAWQSAIAVGLLLALSSTAIVLQSLAEKGLNKVEGGQGAFSVLLFQDIAVIPMLALLPLLAIPELMQAGNNLKEAAEHHQSLSLVAHLPSWGHALVVIAAIGGVIVAGHYLSRPLFRFIANWGSREIFTAASLMLVIGIAALMNLVGLSAALGTFLAGVVLANSEFRHELEANLEPFKGLLLGLFFITVGAGIAIDSLLADFGLIIGLTLGLMAIKGLVIWFLAPVFAIKGSDRWLISLCLAQAGEFGFVLISYTLTNSIISHELGQTLSLVVAMSMLLTPLLFIFYQKVIVPRYVAKEEAREADTITEKGTVIIAGVGRFGQIVNRLLVANEVPCVAIDSQVSLIERMRTVGIRSYYGDATDPNLLHTAGIDQAAAIVIALDDPHKTVELTQYVKRTHPKVKVIARSFDRGHGYQLERSGADTIISETYYSALEAGKQTLEQVGYHPYHAYTQASLFKEVEAEHHDELFTLWLGDGDEPQYGNNYRELFVQLNKTLEKHMGKGRHHSQSGMDRNWNPPPIGYADTIDKE